MFRALRHNQSTMSRSPFFFVLVSLLAIITVTTVAAAAAAAAKASDPTSLTRYIVERSGLSDIVLNTTGLVCVTSSEKTDETIEETINSETTDKTLKFTKHKSLTRWWPLIPVCILSLMFERKRRIRRQYRHTNG
jgi:hypothetical protein